MNKDTLTRLALYLTRWQASTPILALAVAFAPGGTVMKVVIANLVGGLLFFPVDRLIMTKDPHE